MSKETRRVPKLRFPGFTEDWEQRKLIDIAKTFIGLVTTMTENYRDSGTLLIRNSDIKEGQFVFSENPIHLDEEFAEKNKTRRLQIGDVVTVHTGDIGTSAVIEEKEAGAIGFATINTHTDKSTLNPYFLATYFNTEKHKCYANSVSTGDGRSNYNIKDFNKLVISIPTLDEQERISVLINDINTIITLHQRKLDHLNMKKKALLQKLFPKNGERYPELRFSGFTDAWEQRKLSDLATMNARIGWQNLRTSEFLDSGDYLLITGTDFNNGRIKYSTCHYVEKKRFDQDTKIQLSAGSILITKDGTLGKVALVEELPKPATLNAGVFNVRVKDDTLLSYKYLYHYLKAPFLMKYVTANATGGTIKHLNQSILVDFPIPIAEKHEQDKIAKLLDLLESIITLHQRKLEHLQLQKKALLQQMFV